MKQDPEHIRSFIAVRISDTTRAMLGDLQRELKKSGVHASYPAIETLHLTLKFLGDIRTEDIGAIEQSMKKAVAKISPHRLFASGIGVFPSVKRTRIIFSGIRGDTDTLEKLVFELERILLKEMDMKREEKIFRPHLTLARVKKEIDPGTVIRMIKKFENFQTPDFLVSGISLFKSELFSCGAVHTQIFFVPFQKG